MQINPSEKDVTDSWNELLVNVKAYAQLPNGATEIQITHYAMVKNRVMEIVNENEHDNLKASYQRKAGKELNTQHIMIIKNLKAAVMDLINKYAVETAIMEDVPDLIPGAEEYPESPS